MTDDEWEDFITEGLTQWAQKGDPEPLARHLEMGGYVGPTIRKFLAAHLRGQIAKRPGVKATKSAADSRAAIAMDIWMDCVLMGKSLYGAQQDYCKKRKAMNPETLRHICKQRGVTGKAVQRAQNSVKNQGG